MLIVSKIRHQFLFLFIVCLSFSQLIAQHNDQDYELLLKTKAHTPTACVQLSDKKIAPLKQHALDGKYYAILQFYDIPNPTQRTNLKAIGIDLLKYIPNFAYTAAIPLDVSEVELENMGLRAVILPQTSDKIAPKLDVLQQKSSGSIEVIIHLYELAVTAQAIAKLREKGVSIKEQDAHKHLEARLSSQQIEQVAQLPFIQYIEPIGKAEKSLGTRSKSVKGRYLNSVHGGGLEGENVIVGVGDAGAAAHIDFGQRVVSQVEESYLQDDHHSNLVAGMLGGGGVLRERVKGIAPKAGIICDTGSQIINNSNLDANVANGMVLTNNSYGVGEGGDYTSYSERCDEQLKKYPQLMHVFGSGNSGKMDMQNGYPEGYNTVLGHGQSSKNAISVAGINHYNELYTNSSRGPTRDGRLKPEIAAIGYGFVSPGEDNNYGGGFGTSFSAPQVTGGLALLYEYYRNNFGEDPKGALMKAVLCNTAEDLGNPGPDYTYGFGKLNLRRAKQLLDNQQYFDEKITHGQNQNYTIPVPANLTELKVMLYWPDTSAIVSSSKNLVNDLDLRVVGSHNTYLPFVLNTELDKVTDNAFPYVDRTNNIEQVIIKNPTPGNYTVNVSAYQVPYDAQEFYVVYEYVQAGVVLTSPVPGELLPGGGSTNYYIEWDYYGANDHNGDGIEEDFTIQYSPDEGSTWMLLNDSIDSNTRIYKWSNTQLIGINSSSVIVKVSKNNTSYFDVVEQPCKLFDFIGRNDYSVTPLCNDEILFEWQNIDDAISYEILAYEGGEALEVIATTTDTSFTHIYDYDNGEKWFSVRVVYPNNFRSITSDAKLFTPPLPTSTTSCPPSSPGNMSYQTGQYHVQFFWEAATDDSNVIGYVIYMDSVAVDTVNSLDYIVHDTPDMTIEYCVSAIDEHGNESFQNCFSTSAFSQDFCNQDVLFVTQNKELTDNEITIHDYIQSADYYVFTADANNLQNYLWDENWTIIISPEAEIAPNDISLFDGLAMIIMNPDMLEVFNMSSGSAAASGKVVEVVSPYHPAAAGMSGELDFFTGDYSFNGAIHLSPDAIPIITYQNIAKILFAYEAGSTMQNGVVAQQKRVGLPLEFDNVEHFSTAAWTLLYAALSWTADCTPVPPLSPPNLVLTPDFTSIDLQWDTPSPSNDITKYAVYINNTLIGTTIDNRFTINDLNPNTYYKVSVSALNIQQVESTRNYDYATTLTCKNLEIYLWLEGALYEQQISTMRTALNQQNILPGQSDDENAMLSAMGHPYYLPPWNYLEREVVTTYENSVVDMVLVSFRTSPSASSEVFKMAGLLHQNGLIEFPRPCINYEFTEPVYIVVEHRNHIAIMSAIPLSMTNNYIYYDFRNKNSYTNSGSGQKEIFPNIFAMFAGDCDQKIDIGGYQVDGGDKVPWQANNGRFGIYMPEDMNLDGDISGLDKQIWALNNGIYSSVPR